MKKTISEGKGNNTIKICERVHDRNAMKGKHSPSVLVTYHIFQSGSPFVSSQGCLLAFQFPQLLLEADYSKHNLWTILDGQECSSS